MLRRYNLAYMLLAFKALRRPVLYKTAGFEGGGTAETGKKATPCVFASLSFEGATGLATLLIGCDHGGGSPAPAQFRQLRPPFWGTFFCVRLSTEPEKEKGEIRPALSPLAPM